jgi:hypothetical protein
MALPSPPTQPAVCTICLAPLGTIKSPSRQPLPVFPCNHIHCPACLRRNFILSIKTTPFRPVQCCPGQRIEPSLLRQCLSLGSSELAAYRERLSEYDAKVKLYCHDPRCARFIPGALRSGRVGRWYVCLYCWSFLFLSLPVWFQADVGFDLSFALFPGLKVSMKGVTGCRKEEKRGSLPVVNTSRVYQSRDKLIFCSVQSRLLWQNVCRVPWASTLRTMSRPAR